MIKLLNRPYFRQGYGASPPDNLRYRLCQSQSWLVTGNNQLPLFTTKPLLAIKEVLCRNNVDTLHLSLTGKTVVRLVEPFFKNISRFVREHREACIFRSNR